MTDDTQTADRPGYAFNLIAELGNGRQFNVTGSLPTGVTKEAVDAELDKFCASIDRIQSKAAIPALEQEITIMEDQLKAQQRNLDSVAANYKGKNLPVQETREKEQATNAVQALTDKIKLKRKVLEETKVSIAPPKKAA